MLFTVTLLKEGRRLDLGIEDLRRHLAVPPERRQAIAELVRAAQVAGKYQPYISI